MSYNAGRSTGRGAGGVGPDVPLSPVAPVYLVYGEESLLRAEAVAAICAAALDPALADFNQDRFDAGRCAAADVVAATRTLPVMAERRLVVVRGVERFGADDLAVLVEAVADPTPTTCLLLEGEKPDLRRSPFNAVRKVGHAVACNPLYERDVVAWLGQRARRSGYKLEPRAAQFLAAYCGTDLATLAGELDKAAAYAGAGGVIGQEAVEETVGRARVNTVFELTDALGLRRADRALAALHTLLEAGESPVMVQGMIVRQFRLMWLTREAMARGRGGDLAREVGVAPFVAQKLPEQAGRYTSAELARAFARFTRVDLELKGEARSPRIALERQVLGLCGSGSGVGAAR
ncbi:MAG: DNA polymerase III subunit delta [Nitrospirota bacterium]|nr:DNA polymerase III subunit delta [Nitrospirota bacterium]